MLRFLRHYPGMRFQRRGRWEGVRFQPLVKQIVWDTPVWMHCTIKPDLHHFYRSERTNWRQLGDFGQYPTLHAYVERVTREKYGTSDIPTAARMYMERHVYPYLIPYDESAHGPYPALVRALMETDPKYRIIETPTGRTRQRVDGSAAARCTGERATSAKTPGAAK